MIQGVDLVDLALLLTAVAYFVIGLTFAVKGLYLLNRTFTTVGCLFMLMSLPLIWFYYCKNKAHENQEHEGKTSEA